MIGFGGGNEIRSEYPMDMTYRASHEMDRHGGSKTAGYASSNVEPLDRKTAQEWVRGMHHADGSSGEHWTYEQTTQVLKQRNLDCDPVDFYAILNAMWSDYSKVAERFGVNMLDFWAEMAKAFLKDKDAKPDKAALYYECIASRARKN